MSPGRRTMADGAHVKAPCVTCGRCTCARCLKLRRAGKWFAPPGGGYHGCTPAGAKPPGPPPCTPATA